MRRQRRRRSWPTACTRLWVDFARDGSLPWPEFDRETRQVYQLARGRSGARAGDARRRLPALTEPTMYLDTPAPRRPHRLRHRRRAGHRLVLRRGAGRGRRGGDDRRPRRRRARARRATQLADQGPCGRGRRARRDRSRRGHRASPTGAARIDILVNNAGIARSETPAEDVADEHWLQRARRQSQRQLLVRARLRAAHAGAGARAASSTSARCRASSSTARSRRAITTRPRRRCTS